MASLITNGILHIALGFSDDIFNFVWLVFFLSFLDFEGPLNCI
jgi:hypothetical protein